MNELIQKKHQSFINYCVKNERWLDNQKINSPSFNSKKETVLVEFRELPHLYFIIKNTLRVLGKNWSHSIICGLSNEKFIRDIVRRIGKSIRIIVSDKENISRLEYSTLLLQSNFYKQFYGDFLLIYQEDTILFKNIPEKYFKYDFVGAPLPNIKNKFNGGFSLRNRKKMINICELYYDKFVNNFNSTRIFLEKTKSKIKNHGSNHLNNKFSFIYKIEQSILEDLLLCEKCHILPSFNDAREFSVEKYYYKNPVGGHQFWYSLKNIELWLDVNLKKLFYSKCIL